MRSVAYIGFGANLGDRLATLERALEALNDLPVTSVTGCSGTYETEPVGLSDGGPEFLNAVIAVETGLSAVDLAVEMRGIESALGKSPDHQSDLSRVLDLDLLLFGEQIIRTDGLLVPHPRMHERAFVMVPLAEIAPDALHPELGLTAVQVLERLSAAELAGVRCVQGGD